MNNPRWNRGMMLDKELEPRNGFNNSVTKFEQFQMFKNAQLSTTGHKTYLFLGFASVRPASCFSQWNEDAVTQSGTMHIRN